MFEEKKAELKKTYIEARDAWMDTRSIKNMNGDPEKFKAFRDAEKACRMWGALK